MLHNIFLFFVTILITFTVIAASQFIVVFVVIPAILFFSVKSIITHLLPSTKN